MSEYLSYINGIRFFIERFGGPPLYSKRKGHPALRIRHAMFRINTVSAERWLFHMKEALDEVGITGEDREAIDELFNHIASFLKNVED